MILLQGKGVSPGVASGPVRFLRRAEAAVSISGAGADAEQTRFFQAQAQAAARLESLARNLDEASAALFETHALLAQDEDFSAAVLESIQSGASAEYAVQQSGERFADMLRAMDDSYMQARAADVRDVARQILVCLTGADEAPMDFDAPVILAADDLSPSETVRLDRSKILAFATAAGSANSHTAILARSMGIPAVCGLGDALKPDLDGRTAWIDGEAGLMAFDPDESTRAAFDEKLRRSLESSRSLEALISQEDITPDGYRISVCCNIGSTADLPAVLACGAGGIGLFRSEFLYLAADRFPTEEEQFHAYREAAEAMNGRRVVIRTLDAGADKQADFLHLPKEENPALGMRGVRISLSRPGIFRTQLRALYRASAHGKIAILFPMIASAWEMRECKDICRSVMAELAQEGLPFNPRTELGAMIETPASALIADELAKEADFFSVGTNDLTQYLLACDRQNSALERFMDPHHPAVLRSVKMAADAAHAAGIWIGVCGELAADPKQLSAFLSIGVDELSVSPAAVLPLRAAIRGSVFQSHPAENHSYPKEPLHP